MRFSQDFIEKVRDSTNIVDIISAHTQLRRSGPHRWVGLCPFHHEKTPSFSVSEDKQMYHCFGCKRAGNVYTFIQDIQGLSFPETIEMLAQRAGLPLSQEKSSSSVSTSSSALAQDQERERLKLQYRIHQFAMNFFKYSLAHHPGTALDYLKERDLHPEIINKFNLGYSPLEWEALAQLLKKKSISLPEAESLGLIRSRGPGKEGYYDVFRGRLMFPIISTTGHILGFGGRTLEKDGLPKYLNSPESKVFHKGRILYGLNESAKYIRQEDRVIVVEGYMDFLALFQAGLRSVVATLGTALTSDHARLLKRYTKNVVVLFDGDSAGQMAAERSLPLLLAENLTPRGLILPDRLDPDDFIKKFGVEALEHSLRSAQELFFIVLDRYLVGYRGQAAEKIALLDKVAPIVSCCADHRLRHLYINELAERTDLDPHWVRRTIFKPQGSEPHRSVTFNRHLTSKKGDQKNQEVEAPVLQGLQVRSASDQGPSGVEESLPSTRQPIIVAKGAPSSELFLLNVALMQEKFFQMVFQNGILDQLQHEGIRLVFQRAQQIFGQIPNKFAKLTAALVEEVNPPEIVGLHLQSPLVDLTEEGVEKLFLDCTRKIREAYLRSQSKRLRTSLRSDDPQVQLKKLEQIMNIHRSRHSLKKENESEKS